jgi:ligand-binding sensor protein
MNNSNDDTYRIILNIKNCKELDKEDINNIRNMSNEGKMKIILTYNEILSWISNIIEREK